MARVLAPIIDHAQLPLVLTLKEMAAVYRLSPQTIRSRVQRNEFRPLPWDKYPYRWRREDVVRDLETRRPKLKSRRHGYATTKARALTAAGE